MHCDDGNPTACCLTRPCTVITRVLFLQQASAQPSWVTNLPGPPESCPADLISSIQWGTATSAYQVLTPPTNLIRTQQQLLH